MEAIVDANILFSALIKDGMTAELIANDAIRLFAPAYIFEEFLKYERLLLSKTHRSEEKFHMFMSVLVKRIQLLDISQGYIDEARKISPDPYLALALQTGYPIWSNDKRLKSQDRIIIYDTQEIMDRLSA